jgi:polyhydroxybutyrate depolymerase
MKRIKIFFVFAAVMLVSVVGRAKTVTDSVRINGSMRTYKMVMPDNMKSGAPLVVLLHGYGGSDFNAPTCMDSVALSHGFALCVPLGLKDPTGSRSWNVDYPMQEGWKEDDVDVVCQLANHVQKEYRLDKNNTFLTGMSNGGEMCYLMIYRNVKTFKAIASVAGLTLKWMYKDLEPKVQVPFMEIHGTEDRISEWTGDLENKGGWGAYMPVPMAVGRIVALNKCTHERMEIKESLKPESGHYIKKHLYLGADNGCDVWLYEVVGASHCWHTEDMNTGEEIWRFFSQYID